jgi:Tol biopolymer transport system component
MFLISQPPKGNVMQTKISGLRLSALWALPCLVFVFFLAKASQLVSQPLPGSGHSNGDSGPSMISADGRYVLFSSAANNLAPNRGGTHPISIVIPGRLNVYLRDLSNDITTLISVNLSGYGGNGDSIAMGISSNGQYALFQSAATDLLPGDTNTANDMAGDIFLRDLVHGTTALVSVSTNGGFGNGISHAPVMTPDGRYVAFVSAADNLVSGDSNGIPDIFIRDTQLKRTILASSGAMSSGTGSGSADPVITPDGRYVAFYSTATNLASGVATTGDIYVYDLTAGTTYWASSGARAELKSVFNLSSGVCFSPCISADGSTVAYEASAANYLLSTGLVLCYYLAGGTTKLVSTNANAPAINYEDIRTLDINSNGQFVASVANSGASRVNTAIWLWNAVTETNQLVSATVSGGASANGISYAPVLDPSGRYVAFLSTGTNLTTNPLSGEVHLYRRDTQADTTTLVDANAAGAGMGVAPETFPSWDASAGHLVYESFGLSDRNQYYDTLVYNVGSNSNEVVSVPDPLFSFPSADGPSVMLTASASANGEYVAFASDADNLAPDATNGYRNVFVCDLNEGTNILVSLNTNDVAATGNSSQPSISGDGRFVAFSSSAPDIVPGLNAGTNNVFVRDMQQGLTTLVSVETNGAGPGNGNSFAPTISSDGRFVMFLSQAQNLAAGTFVPNTTNLFLRDLQANVTYALTATSAGEGVASAGMTPDAHYIAFIGEIPGSSSPNLYVWDSFAAALIYTNTTASISEVSISSNGQRLAYTTLGSPSALYVADLIDPTNDAEVASGPSGSFPTRVGLSFSGNGSFLAYSTTIALSAIATNKTNDVYLYNVTAKTNLLISRSISENSDGNGVSDSPVVSPDGRFIAYRSSANNIVPGNSNGVPNILLYDQNSEATTLLTASQYGLTSGDNRSANPFFSADGQTLVFQSAAYDLVTNDFNRDGDVFEYNLFTAGMIPAFTVQAIPGNAAFPTTLIWPALPGKVYQVMFKNNLTDLAWEPLSGNITILGSTAYFTDPNPAAVQRFYWIEGH